MHNIPFIKPDYIVHSVVQYIRQSQQCTNLQYKGKNNNAFIE